MLGVVDEESKREFTPVQIKKILTQAGINPSKYIIDRFPIMSVVYRPEPKQFSSGKGSQNEPWTAAYMAILNSNQNDVGAAGNGAYQEMAKRLYYLVCGG
jgi:hypothetical protein